MSPMPRNAVYASRSPCGAKRVAHRTTAYSTHVTAQVSTGRRGPCGSGWPFPQVSPAVGVELRVALEQLVDPAFERRQLGIGHGLAILRAPLDVAHRQLRQPLQVVRCRLRRRLLMAGLRLVNSPAGSLSTSAKIALVSRSSNSAVVNASWSAGNLQFAVVQPLERQRREQLLAESGLCHIAITSCTG